MTTRIAAGALADVADKVLAFPVLTGDVGALNGPASGGGVNGFGPGGVGSLVSRALNEVLGWKVRSDDADGITTALNRSFTSIRVNGIDSFSWTPRSYSVQNDLGAAITGAQASLFQRAQQALEQALPLLDGLVAMDVEADLEDVDALKAVLRKQLQELVAELGYAGGPRVQRVDGYFALLLGGDGVQTSTSEPDRLKGSTGRLRDLLGMRFSNGRVNTVDDECNLTQFRILCDHMTSLQHSWAANRKHFDLTAGSGFLGTQLVHLSRQLSVISESVQELRFGLDTVFIGAAERQTLLLDFGNDQMLYAEDFLNWIHVFVTQEAVFYVEEGGKYGISKSLLPIAKRLSAMCTALGPGGVPQQHLPKGFGTARVQNALLSLSQELERLTLLADELDHDFTPEPPHAQLRQLVDLHRLLVSGGDLEFGPKDLQRTLSIANLSEQPITACLDLDSEAMLHFRPASSSVTVDPAGTALVDIICNRFHTQGHAGRLTITYNDPVLAGHVRSITRALIFR